MRSIAPIAWLACLALGLTAAAGARAQVPLEGHSALVLMGTRGAPLPVVDARVVLGGDAAQPFVGARLATDTLTVDATVGVQARPVRGPLFALRTALAGGPTVSALDGTSAGLRLVLEAQGELRAGDLVASAGPRLESALVVDGAAIPKLAATGTLALGWMPPRGLGVLLVVEGGPSFTPRGSGLVGSASVGVVLPLPGA